MSDWGTEVVTRRGVLKAAAAATAAALIAPKAVETGLEFINSLTAPPPPGNNTAVDTGFPNPRPAPKTLNSSTIVSDENQRAANRIEVERKQKEGNFMSSEDAVRMYLDFTGDKTPDKKVFREKYPGVEVIDNVESGDDGLRFRNAPGIPSDGSPGTYDSFGAHAKLPFPGLVIGSDADGQWAITREDNGKLAYFAAKNTAPIKSK